MNDQPENTDILPQYIQRESGKWVKGQSGNPKGRPKGSKNKASLLAQHLIEEQVEEIVKSAVSAAKYGENAVLLYLLKCLLGNKS